VTDRTVRVVLTGDATALIAAVNAARNSLNELNRQDTTRVQGGVRGAGGAAREAQSAFDKLKSSMAAQVGVGNLAAMGVMSAFFAVKQAITDTVHATTDYQTTLFTLQAVTHASGEVMVDVAAKARELGKDITIPGASATDAAKAMTELAKGGLSASQAMTAAKGTLLLAAAASVTASQAAEIEVNTLNAYGLAATEAGRVSNVLANVSNQASGEMTDFANGLKMVGSTAHGFGISLEDTTTVLGLFANAGIKGEMGGTLLNTMLVRLAAPTKQSSEALATLGVTTFDASGKFEGMQAVTDQLRSAHDRLTPAAYAAATAIAFGTRGIRGAQILGGETASAYGLMGDAITKAGGDVDLAGAKMQGLEGAFQQLTNQVQDAQLALGLQFAPALTLVTTVLGDIVGALAVAINWFGELPLPIKLGVIALGTVLLLKGPIVSLWDTIALKAMYSADSVAAAGGIMRFSMAAVGTAAKAMWTAVGGWIGVGIAAITTAFTLFGGSTETAAAGTADFTDAVDKNTGALTKNASATIAKQVADSGSGDLYRGISGNIADYTAALAGNKQAQDAVHTAILDAATAGVESSSVWQTVGASLMQQGTSARDVASGLLKAGDAGKYQSDQLTAALNVSGRFADDSGKLSTAQDHVKQAIAGAGDAAGGAAGSQDALNASIAQGLDPATQMNTALKDYKTQADFATTASDFLWASLQELAGHQIDAEHQTRLTDAAFRDMAASARAVTQANTDVGNASQKTADAQKKLDDLSNHLGKTLDGQNVSASNLAVTQADVDQASRDLTTAQNAEATAHDAVSKAQDTQFDSTTKVVQSQIDAAAKAYALKAATGDVAGASRDLTAATEAARQKFIDAQTQINGGNIPAAVALADKYGLIPKYIETSIRQAGVPEALNELQRLRQAIADLPDSKIVKVAVESGSVVYTTASGEKMQAEGGYISGPGTSTSDSIRARLSDGEFVVRASQTAKHRDLLESINTPGFGFADGGMVSKNILLQAYAGNLVDTGWQKGVNDQSLKIAKSSAAATAAAVGNVNYNLSAGVEQWRGVVDQALAILGQPTAYDSIVLNQMRTESSGNPNAINLTDINAQRGIPSKGLVQVIDPTFRSYAVAPYNQNIWDPLSNVLAGINYAIHRYGSIPAGMRGVAYDNGGPIPPGFTMAYNGTGQTEWALTGAQMNAATSAMSSVGSLSGGSQPINLTLTLLGDGPLTESMLSAAQATVGGALREVALTVNRSRGQS
jgi:TP901 family phage tail tape measure protein